MSWSDEAAYNAEVHRLINEGMKCPICDSPPVYLHGIEPGRATMGTCRNGHSYYVDGEEE